MTKRLRPHYLSTYCHHEEHDRCRLTCKVCREPCVCPCHESDTARRGTVRAFRRDALPPPEEFVLYRKRWLTPAMRVDGPFEVQTREGRMRCEDGWLAIDAGGYPYPIAAEEFAAIYERVD